MLSGATANCPQASSSRSKGPSARVSLPVGRRQSPCRHLCRSTTPSHKALSPTFSSSGSISHSAQLPPAPAAWAVPTTACHQQPSTPDPTVPHGLPATAPTHPRRDPHKQLTLNVTSATSLADVASALEAAGSTSANDINVAAAAWQLVQLSSQRQPDGRQRGQLERMLVALTSLSLPILPSFTASTLSVTLWAFGKLRHNPGKRWLGAFFDASFACLPDYSPKHLTITLWALGQLRHRPGRLWMERWLARSLGTLPAAPASSLSIALHSIATLRVAPQPEWLHAWMAAGSSALPECSSQELSNVLWSLAELSHVPQAPWMCRYLEAAALRRGQYSAQGVANTIWALAALGQHPGDAWLCSFLLSGSSQLLSFQPCHLSMMAWALGQLKHLPPSQFMSRFLACSHQQLADPACAFEPQALSNLLYGLATIPCHPSQEWMAAYLARTKELPSSGFTDQSLSNMLYALALMEHRPSMAWLRRHLRRCSRLLDDFQPQALANTCWALGLLKMRPPLPWLRTFAAACAPQLQDFSPQEASMLLWGLARMSYWPKQQWMEAFEARTAPMLQACAPRNISNMLWAMARFRYSPSAPWLRAALGVLAAHMAEGSCNHQDCSNTLWALAQLRLTLPSGWLQAFYSTTQGLLSEMPQQGLAQVAWGVAQLKLKPPRPWLQQLLDTATARQQELGLLTATSLLLCFAAAGGFAADARLGLLVSRARQQMGRGGEGLSFTQLSRCDNDLQAALSQLQQQWRHQQDATAGMPASSSTFGSPFSTMAKQAQPPAIPPEQPPASPPDLPHPPGQGTGGMDYLRLVHDTLPKQQQQQQQQQQRTSLNGVAAVKRVEHVPLQHSSPQGYPHLIPAHSCASSMPDMAAPVKRPSPPVLVAPLCTTHRLSGVAAWTPVTSMTGVPP